MMKQVTLNIPESKYTFFMELVENLGFVNSEGDSRNAILSNIKKGFEEVQLAKKGKLKTTPAKEFLNEL
ncbi:MAG: hypothetical protein JKY53_01370 [Flavobacteriales bacterium]|nr:hypothetical protein [Flavobacteriales bacterium]